MWAITPRNSLTSGSLGFEVSDGEKKFGASSEEEAKWLADALDEVTNTVVKLYCTNKQCKGVGGYITRTASDAKKSMYACDDCGKLMTRRLPEAEKTGSQAKSSGPASEKQAVQTPVLGDNAGMARVRAEQLAKLTSMAPIPVAPVAPVQPEPAVPFTPEQMMYLEARIQVVQDMCANAIGQLASKVITLESEFAAMGESFQSTLQMLDSIVSAQKT